MNQFKLKYHCEYTDLDNNIINYRPETFLDGKWKPYSDVPFTAGFQYLLLSIMSCQHLYFKTNSAEKGLVLTKSDGSLVVETDKKWKIHLLHIEINGYLKSGNPTQKDIDFIIRRMGHCPASINLNTIKDSYSRINYI